MDNRTNFDRIHYQADRWLERATRRVDILTEELYKMHMILPCSFIDVQSRRALSAHYISKQISELPPTSGKLKRMFVLEFLLTILCETVYTSRHYEYTYWVQ